MLENPKIARSSVYRVLVKEKINTIPEEKNENAKKFKEYELGYLHIDVITCLNLQPLLFLLLWHKSDLLLSFSFQWLKLPIFTTPESSSCPPIQVSSTSTMPCNL